MRIENLTIALYPRSPWAAIDLGFAMARRWWGTLLASWLLVALPVFVLVQALSYSKMWVASLVIWWLKPAFEQLPLLFLSRAVFGQKLTLRAVAREGRGWVGRQLLGNLSWRRLSGSRSFNAAVAQLEQLRGAERRARLAVLHDGHSARSWLTIVCPHLEMALFFGALILAYYLVPQELTLWEWLTQEKAGYQLGENIVYFAAIAVIAPFYIAAGFSLYLHRRTELEGWDIELEFRRWSERVRPVPKAHVPQGAAVMLIGVLCVVALTAFSNGVAMAAEAAPVARTEAKRMAEEVLSDPDFGHKEKNKHWRWKHDQNEKLKNSAQDNWSVLLAQIGEVLLWIGAAAGAVYVIYRLPQWLQWAQRKRRRGSNAALPAVLFGLDVSGEHLPAQVAETALRMVERGDVRGALGLLYRASLVVLMRRDGVSFESGATEQQCVEILQRYRSDALVEYFSEMTRHWQRMAYGHRVPEGDLLRGLCRGWATHFEAAP